MHLSHESFLKELILYILANQGEEKCLCILILVTVYGQFHYRFVLYYQMLFLDINLTEASRLFCLTV